ncbi:hypothetical protein C0993_012567 [Termitomyces sp. T159_Od127]|nr:hypothetical protein C0993_012567 [Termitomyces sp. T159_Od127]
MTAPQHNFVLSNPFTLLDGSDDDDDSSLNSLQPHTPNTAHPASGFRAQLNHLLPRHVFFHVNLHVHQITDIPLVSGEFAVKWNFKNAHGASSNKSGSGLLESLKARRKARKKEKEKRATAYTDFPEQGVLADAGSNQTDSVDGHVSMYSANTTATSSSSSSGSSKAQKSTDTTASSSAPVLPPSVSAPTTPARGQTQFLRLKDHGVVWEHTLSLLLTVLQRDSTRPEVKPLPFGVVMLDLAQYASKGEVERRYLLRESKTNATLKLTTHLTHIPSTSASSSAQPHIPISSTSSATITTTTSVSGTPNSTSCTTNIFTAPPLPKGEILNGISSILQGDSLLGGFEGDMYRVRPKGLDLYGPYYDQEELEFDILGGRAAPTSPGKRAEKDKDKAKGRKGKGNDMDATPIPAPTPVRTRKRSSTQFFDPSRLPLAYGTKTTELLIEALFNPVETRHKEKESPFTVYVPDPLEGVPKRPAATPLQRPLRDPSTPIINTDMRTTFIDASPPMSRSRSGSAQQRNLSPPMSYTVSTSGSGASSSDTTLEATLIAPDASPLLPSTSSRSTSSSSYLTSPQASATSSPMTTPGPAQPQPPQYPSRASSSSSKKRGQPQPQPQRAGNTGIGAGLGIMGLGMGMGVGMGVRVGVSGTRRMSVDDESQGVEKDKDKEDLSTGVKAWLRRAAKGSSRPGTPTTIAKASVGAAP